jgi:CheY-like chemotaxis protein
VQDDGTGIKPDILTRIFDPFYTTKRPGGGTGLGLSICASIIREHRGTIDAETLPAGGAAFTVYLPAIAPAKSTPAAHVSEDRSSMELARENGNGLQGRAVLVLDDEESIRSLLQEGLSAHGMRVDCADCAEQAMGLAAKRSYDLLLCDVNLTGQGSDSDGAKVADRILLAAAEPKPTTVLMTGDYVDAAKTKPGEPRRVQKPFRVADILAIMREVIQRDSPTTIRQ